MEILRFANVSYNYHTPEAETPAVENLNLCVEKGNFVSIIGPSGCGKSTILSLAAGLLQPSRGEVSFFGKNRGYMLQRDELFPWRTIEKNLLLPLEIARCVTPERKEFVRGLAEKYGLGEFLERYPEHLSGGMRQRAALIRTLAADPELLLLDEPFSALDYQTRLAVSEDVGEILRKEGKTALLVTHDVSEAIALSDCVIVLSRRPATCVAVHESDFPRDMSPSERRRSPLFGEWFETLRKELHL